LIETDGVALCIHYRRLKKDRPVPPSAASVTKNEEKEEAGPAKQEVEDNDLVVHAAKDEEKKEAGPATQEVEGNDLVVDVTKDEEKKDADPAMQEVENNSFMVNATKHEEKKEAGPAMQEVHEKDLLVGAAKDEDEKDADPATQEVENNDFMVDVTKHEENKDAGPATQKVQDNDFVVGADPGNTNIITIAAPKRAEDRTDGNLRQKDMRLLRFSRARYYRESGIMNARKKIETWNSGMKEHLEAVSEVTSRGADFEAFRKFMEVRVARWDALWEEYTKPRWARLRMNLYGGRQRAFANFFNQLSALKEDESQRLVVAYAAGRWKTQKGTTPAPTTRTFKECARRFVTIPVDEFRTSYTHHELGCTLQRVEMEKCQRRPEDIKKYGPLTEEQMERMSKVRGLLALVSTTSDGKKRMEFVNRDFNAAINMRKCAVLEKRPPELTGENFVGQPLKVELYEKKLEAVVGGRSRKAGRRLHVR
jgi:hypothetical protein